MLYVIAWRRRNPNNTLMEDRWESAETPEEAVALIRAAKQETSDIHVFYDCSHATMDETEQLLAKYSAKEE